MWHFPSNATFMSLRYWFQLHTMVSLGILLICLRLLYSYSYQRQKEFIYNIEAIVLFYFKSLQRDLESRN